MTLTVSDIFIAVVLVSCVPIQYLIVQNWGLSESNRSYTIKRLITNLSNFYEEYLTIDAWQEWLFRILKISKFSPSYGSDNDGESPAVEVMKFKQNKGYFAMSPDPRTYRSPYVEFRIGQVVVHKTGKYRGVIIGWDENAKCMFLFVGQLHLNDLCSPSFTILPVKAPPEWIAEMDAENKRWRNMPNYALLVDTRDRLTPQLTYVPQENIKVIKSTKIIHPHVENYFENYDGAQYIPRPWLRTLYPQD